MRRKIIAGNWKMNKTVPEAADLAGAVVKSVAGVDGVDVVVIPTYPCLSKVAEAISGSNVKLGAQNVFWEESGAFTGEVSTAMLLSAGCEYVVIGHSERRQYFGETDETVNKRMKAASASGLKPIMCVGETLEERDGDKVEEVLKRQVEGGLADISEEQMATVVLAYEPVWAIGTGRTATKEQAEDAHRFIRGLLRGLYGDAVADATRIQYGGSVKPSNAVELLSQENIDGALVGGAALDADSFAGIVDAAK
ncbi:triose-phosphate isomerase [Candidatus Hydrogenedentota bacterium]